MAAVGRNQCTGVTDLRGWAGSLGGVTKIWEDLPTIDDVESLEAVGVPHPMIRDKVLDRLGPFHIGFINAAPLVFVATASPDGRCDVSPKGDPAGFVKVLDDTTLVLPERSGNNRLDGFHNILDNPHAGFLFVIPGRGDTLRVNGEIRIVTDGPFFDDLIVKGHRPDIALVMHVEEAFFHCPKAFMRSKSWKPDAWKPDAAPSYAEMAKVMWNSADADDKAIERRYEEVLYADRQR